MPRIAAVAVAGAVAWLGTLGSVVSVQTTAAGSPAEKLEYYVGSWAGQGKMRESSGAAFKAIAGGETCRWAAGHSAVLCSEQERGPGGGWDGVYIVGYDSGAKAYTVYGIEKPGTYVQASGTIAPDGSWTWKGQGSSNGQTFPVRYVFREVDRNRRTMTVETQDDKGNWFTIVDHTYTRARR